MRRLQIAFLLALTLVAHGAPAAELSPEHHEFLESVSSLISEEERAVFLALTRDYQRDAFIEKFWDVRDPFPQTAVNEFRDTWDVRVELARERFGTLEGARAGAMLLYGVPREVQVLICSELKGRLEVWEYEPGPRIPRSFNLVFTQRGVREDGYALWSPRDGLDRLLTWSLGVTDRQAAQQIASECPRGGDILGALAGVIDWEELEERYSLVPEASAEWVQTFASRSTNLPESAQTFPSTLDLSFPGRYQSRTVVQGLVSVERADIAVTELAGRRFYNFLLDGEVLRQGELFDHFRYRFDLPVEQVQGETIPLAVQRYLRPGEYRLILKVEDLASGAFARHERELSVPNVRFRRAEGTGLPAPKPLPTETRDPGAVADRLAEANAALSVAGEHTLRILPPPRELVTGRLRVEAIATGDGVAKVTFALDGRRVMSKTRPPFSVELDLGKAPRMHTLEAAALDADGTELASDELVVNAGAQSFSVRLIEPRRGQRYTHSLRARAEVDIPVGETLDRVEVFLNEDKLATLYQSPWVQPVMLPGDGKLTYVRAVAYLADGNSTEDLVFVNAPDFLDRIQVDLVELYTTVLDRQGRPVDDLTAESFRVIEDGVEQEIRRFERVRDLPVHAGILLDTSLSMIEELEAAERAALRFFELVLTPRDRAAVITFNDRPSMAVPFTNSIPVLAGGLAGLKADGETTLYDSLVFGLYYFSGIRGKKALILISDGEDSRSQYSYTEALEYAHHAGVAIYTIGLNVPHRSQDVRGRLQRLANETGGRFFYIQRASGLDRIYDEIQEELRSQYLIAYQSTGEGSEEEGAFREVEVEVTADGQKLQAKTIRGYYPSQ